MSEIDKVLGYLQSISPRRATNEEIRVNTGVKPHPKVYQITQRLLKAGEIEGQKVGLEWSFRVAAPIEREAPAPTTRPAPPPRQVQHEAPGPVAGPDDEKVVRYLQSLSPSRATSDEIRINTGVTPNSRVYEVTQRLMKTGHIEGRKVGLEWAFWIAGRTKPEVPERAAAPKLREPAAEPKLPEPVVEPELPEPVAAPEPPEPVAAPELPEPVAAPEPPEPDLEPELAVPLAELELTDPIAEPERPAPAVEPEPVEPIAEEAAPGVAAEPEPPAAAADLEPPAPMDSSEVPAATKPDLRGFGTSDFETIAQRVMSEHFDAELGPTIVPGIHKVFNLVSSDRRIMGHAKSFAPIRGDRLPTAEFSMIAERVWLLEKAKARYRFLVFGHDEQVPLGWLERYGNLSSDVEFYHLSDDGRLKRLASG